MDGKAWASLGDRVTSRRTELGLSVTAAAKAAGIDRGTWDDLEKARRQTRQQRWPGVERTLGWREGSINAILEGGEPTIRERVRVSGGALADEIARIRALPIEPEEKLRAVSELLSIFEAVEKDRSPSGQH